MKNGELVLGPFQGPVACTRIPFHKGVCGHAYTTAETILVPDVDLFPGHIACSSETNSEIVLPVINAEGKVVAVLDIDSITFNDFDAVDQKYLEKLKQYELKSDKTLINKYGMNARKYIVEEFSKDKILNQFLKTFRKLSK